ncbi:MAG: redoxin domain-containing protein [Bacteroidales bacterium]|nr:redoxin domain-containing protein [Bacteroidales bacterium]
MALDLHAQVRPMMEDWSDVDFSDTALITSEAFSARMVNELYLNTSVDDMTQFDSLSMVSIAILLDKSKANMRVYEYVLEFMLKGFTNMGRTQVVDYLLNYPMLREGDITESEGVRLDSITEPYQLVKVGVKAPDYTGVTIDGLAYDLYASKAEWIIVVFWSTDCEYCHDFLEQIRKHLDLKSGFELLTFALAEDQEEVADAVKKMRLPGYHFYDELRWESKAFLDYHVTSTPTVFLLDSEKKIVCKPYDWTELKYWLKSNNIKY